MLVSLSGVNRKGMVYDLCKYTWDYFFSVHLEHWRIPVFCSLDLPAFHPVLSKANLKLLDLLSLDVVLVRAMDLWAAHE